MNDELIYQKLRQYFGFSSFRDGQLTTIKALLRGQDTLAVLPTGGGKSLLYQLPGYLMAGTVLIVSPLLSLMQDQVDRLHRQGEKRVVMLTGQVYGQARHDLLSKLSNYKFVFASPEILTNQEVMTALGRIKIAFLTVDEAHCISQWGPDFRPEYLMLKQLRHQLGNPTTLMLTATATPAVRRDILQKMGLATEQVCQVCRSVNRANIFLAVEQCETDDEKRRKLLKLVRKLPGAGIIYFASRRLASEVAEWLQANSPVNVAAYHAGMAAADRFRIQQQFMVGQVQVVCATSAFGMGVDKNDIRFVIHYHLPGNLESYVQEIGRAGRDGRQSVAVLLYTAGDEQLQRQLATVELPSTELMQQVQKGKLNERALGPDYEIFSFYLHHHFSADQVIKAFKRRQQQRFNQVRLMQNYIENTACRRNFILRYFGEQAIDQEKCCDSEMTDWAAKDLLPERHIVENETGAFDWQQRLRSLLNLIKE